MKKPNRNTVAEIRRSMSTLTNAERAESDARFIRYLKKIGRVMPKDKFEFATGKKTNNENPR